MEDYTQGVSATKDATSPSTTCDGTASPISGPAMIVERPTTSPRASLTGPPELAGRNRMFTTSQSPFHGPWSSSTTMVATDATREPYPIGWAIAQRPWLARSEPFAHGIAVAFEPAHVQPDAFE